MPKKRQHKITKLSDVFENDITRSIIFMNMSYDSGLKPIHYKVVLMKKIPSHKYKKMNKKKEYDYKKSDPRYKEINIDEIKEELINKSSNTFITLAVKGCIKSESNLNHYFDVLDNYDILKKNKEGYYLTKKGNNEFLRWILKNIIEKSSEKELKEFAESIFKILLKDKPEPKIILKYLYPTS